MGLYGGDITPPFPERTNLCNDLGDEVMVGDEVMACLAIVVREYLFFNDPEAALLEFVENNSITPIASCDYFSRNALSPVVPQPH